MPAAATAIAARTFPALGTFATAAGRRPGRADARRTTCSPRSLPRSTRPARGSAAIPSSGGSTTPAAARSRSARSSRRRWPSPWTRPNSPTETWIPPAGRAWSGSATTGTSPAPAGAQAPCASRRCPQAAGAGSNSTRTGRRCGFPPGSCSTWGPPPRRWPPTGRRPPSRPPRAAASWSTWAVTSGWPGTRPDGGWRVGIADDAGFDASTASVEPRQVVMISDGGLATSSTLGRAWRRGGADLHHIIDPSTGRPARSCWRTVSVAAASCVDANIASTAAILRGERAIRWLAGCGCPPAWSATTARSSPSPAGPRGRRRAPRDPRTERDELRLSRTGPVVRHPGDRPGGPAAADRQRAARDPHRGPVRQRELAPVPVPGPAPQHLAAGAGVPGPARGHDGGRHLHLHPADRRVRPVRLRLQDGLAEPRRGRARPAAGPGGDQPGPQRLGHRAWRRVHWLAYACWPVAVAHGLGIGTDRSATWVSC